MSIIIFDICFLSVREHFVLSYCFFALNFFLIYTNMIRHIMICTMVEQGVARPI